MTFSCTKYSRASGFTLLELSIVLVIIAVIVGASLASGLGVIASARQAATLQKIAAIEKAIMAYRTAYDRIPCPANATIVTGATNFGVEAVNPGSCTSASVTPVANMTSVGIFNYGAVAEGAVPVVTLGLPNDFMFDGWGNHFRYGVDTLYTLDGAFSFTGTGFTNPTISMTQLFCESQASINSGIYGTTGSPYNTQCGESTGFGMYPVYTLVSHGANGHGAYNYNGVVASMDSGPDAGSLDYNEGINSHTTSGYTTGPTTYVRSYVNTGASLADKYYSSGSNVGTSYFDDIVDYKDRAQMALPRDNTRASPEYLIISTTASPYLYGYLLINGTQVATNTLLQSSQYPGGYTNRLQFTYDDRALLFSGSDNKVYEYIVTGAGTEIAQSGMSQSPGTYCGYTASQQNILCLLNSASITTVIAPISFGAQYANGNTKYSADNTTFSALSHDTSSHLLAVSATSPDYVQLFFNPFNQTYNAYVATAQGTNILTSTNANSSSKATVEWSIDNSTLYYLSPVQQYLFGYTLTGNTLAFNSALAVNLSSTGYLSGLYSTAVSDLSVHPSGNYIAIAGGNYVVVFSLPLSTTPSLVAVSTVGTSVTSIAWSPDGNYLAVDDATNGLNILKFSQSTASFSSTTFSGSGMQCGANSTGLSKPAWSADGAYLAVANDTSGSGLCLYARTSSTVFTLLSGTSSPSGVIKALAFSHVASGTTTAP